MCSNLKIVFFLLYYYLSSCVCSTTEINVIWPYPPKNRSISKVVSFATGAVIVSPTATGCLSLCLWRGRIPSGRLVNAASSLESFRYQTDFNVNVFFVVVFTCIMHFLAGTLNEKKLCHGKPFCFHALSYRRRKRIYNTFGYLSKCVYRKLKYSTVKGRQC